MKRTISLLLACAMMLSGLYFFASADGITVQRCVTWKLFPTKSTDSRDHIRSSYIAEYYSEGQVPTAPKVTPTYEDDGDYFYNFLGWKRISGQQITDYMNDPSLGYTSATFVQEKFAKIETDVVYGAIYGKDPKWLAIDDDTYISITDVTLFLSYLSGEYQKEIGPGRDANKDGICSIEDLTEILYYLTLTEQIKV